jgi:hypothetical protein
VNNTVNMAEIHDKIIRKKFRKCLPFFGSETDTILYAVQNVGKRTLPRTILWISFCMSVKHGLILWGKDINYKRKKIKNLRKYFDLRRTN